MTSTAQDQDFQTTLDLTASPETVFEALTTTSGVSSWWAPATGSASTGGDLEFKFGEHHPALPPRRPRAAAGLLRAVQQRLGQLPALQLVSYLETGTGHPAGS